MTDNRNFLRLDNNNINPNSYLNEHGSWVPRPITNIPMREFRCVYCDSTNVSVLTADWVSQRCNVCKQTYKARVIEPK